MLVLCAEIKKFLVLDRFFDSNGWHEEAVAEVFVHSLVDNLVPLELFHAQLLGREAHRTVFKT